MLFSFSIYGGRDYFHVNLIRQTNVKFFLEILIIFCLSQARVVPQNIFGKDSILVGLFTKNLVAT